MPATAPPPPPTPEMFDMPTCSSIPSLLSCSVSLRQPALPGDMRGTKAARLRKYNKDLKDAYDVAASKKDKTASRS